MNRTLILPALSGSYQNWIYFQVIFKLEELVENFGDDLAPDYRIKTTDEVDVIYSRTGIGNLLQRAIDTRRIDPIKRFVLDQPDSYVNNLTIAIFGGTPEWIPFDVPTNSLDSLGLGSEVDEFIKAYGVIKLNGDETLFVLDGQHRLRALREAFKENQEIGANKIAVTFITHIDDEQGREKTRRLFSIINRHAKPVSLGENILLDEDDLSALITRITVENYQKFLGKSLIALNKTADLKLPKDSLKFSTAICLWSVNELLIDYREVYPDYSGPLRDLVRIRPSDEVIEEYKNLVFDFWDTFFSTLPIANSFVDNPSQEIRSETDPYSLRPIGQQLFCDLYLEFKRRGLPNFASIVALVPESLHDPFWHYVLYNPISGNIMRNRPYARDYVSYMLGLSIPNRVLEKLLKNYRKFTQNQDLSLPNRLIPLV